MSAQNEAKVALRFSFTAPKVALKPGIRSLDPLGRACNDAVLVGVAYGRYLGGKGRLGSTAETRRTSLRVHGLSGSIWAWALSVDHGEEYVSFAAEIEIERTNAAMP